VSGLILNARAYDDRIVGEARFDKLRNVPRCWFRFIFLFCSLGCTSPPKPTKVADSKITTTIRDPSVLTQHNDNLRSGANLNEFQLDTSNVNPGSFGLLYSRQVDGYVYAQPLYVRSVAIAGSGEHNVLIVATEHNSVYAFDADDPAASDPLWQVSVGPSMPSDDIRTDDDPTFRCHDLTPEVGITATPVIDASSQTIFVVAKTEEAGAFFYRLHALDLGSGGERPNSPVTIAASVPGTGWNSSDGRVSFDPYRQLNRPGLLLSNGFVVLAFGSHCDIGPYFGWVLAYDAVTLEQTGAYADTANGGAGGIWQAGGGLAADSYGKIYLMSGNGSNDGPAAASFPDPNVMNLGNSFIALSASQTQGLSAIDWFTPHDIQTLNDQDLDLGSSGLLLVPWTNLLVGGGKEGVFYVLNRDQLGGFTELDTGAAQAPFLAANGHIHGSPVYWNSSQGAWMYVWSEEDYPKAFAFDGTRFDPNPGQNTNVAIVHGMPGGMLAVTADGNTPASGVLWASHPYDQDANQMTVTGILRAFDAGDITRELWNSKMSPEDDVGNFAKFCAPTVADGKVFLGTFSGVVRVYGLRSTTEPQRAQIEVPGLKSELYDSSGQVNQLDVDQWNWYLSNIPSVAASGVVLPAPEDLGITDRTTLLRLNEYWSDLESRMIVYDAESELFDLGRFELAVRSAAGDPLTLSFDQWNYYSERVTGKPGPAPEAVGLSPALRGDPITIQAWLTLLDRGHLAMDYALAL
jgi:hypothetical protein